MAAGYNCDSEDHGSAETLLTLTGVCTQLEFQDLERKIAGALEISSERVSVMIDEDQVHFTVYPDKSGASLPAEDIANKINGIIERGEAKEWLGAQASCSVADMEEEVLVDEEEALNMWREMPEDARTSHLSAVPSPDGVPVLPSHELSAPTPDDFVSPTQAQLKRDSGLLDFDNVVRVDISQISTVSWTEPVIITGVPLDVDGNFTDTKLVEKFGEAEVRTGNRYTLVENGFVNSRPMSLSDALTRGEGTGDPECGRIVFSPVHNLPEPFQQELSTVIEAFPCEHVAQGKEAVPKKFTLCLGTEGFGIGFHRHNAAMFLLVVGRKKWYMGPQATEDDTPTHPGFYDEKSSHKCIQQPGELLYVPDQWYHEIFNLEYTCGVQALPGA